MSGECQWRSLAARIPDGCLGMVSPQGGRQGLSAVAPWMGVEWLGHCAVAEERAAFKKDHPFGFYAKFPPPWRSGRCEGGGEVAPLSTTSTSFSSCSCSVDIASPSLGHIAVAVASFLICLSFQSCHSVIGSPTFSHSLTHSRAHSLAHSPARSLARSLTYSLIYSLTPSLTHSSAPLHAGVAISRPVPVAHRPGRVGARAWGRIWA